MFWLLSVFLSGITAFIVLCCEEACGGEHIHALAIKDVDANEAAEGRTLREATDRLRQRWEQLRNGLERDRADEKENRCVLKALDALSSITGT